MKKLAGLLSAIVTLAMAGSVQAETLVLGSVSHDVRKQVERLTPLSNYLEHHLADHGITAVEISVLPSSYAMVHAMRDGEVDLFFDSPLVAGRVARLADAVPFLRRWKEGVGEYHSMLIVPTDSAVQSVADLEDATIGFENKDSTSGFLLPARMIRNAGLPLIDLDSTQDQPPVGSVGYVFTGDDRNSVYLLARGHIAAAATDPRGMQWLEEAQPGAFRVIARSITVPRNIVVRRGDMDEALVARMSDILTAMNTSYQGAAALTAFANTTAFDAFPDGVEATFEPINRALDDLSNMNLF